MTKYLLGLAVSLVACAGVFAQQPDHEALVVRIKVRNQFAKDASVVVVRSLFLAAPSLKLDWKVL